MTRFMRFRRSISKGYRGAKVGNDWGDWLSMGEKTPIEYIDAVYFAQSSRLMAEMAGAIGKDEDAADYATLFENIRAAWRS